MLVIQIRLRECMATYRRRTSKRMTYGILAKRIEMSRSTLSNLGSEPFINTTLKTISKICVVLETTPAELLEMVEVPDLPGGADGWAPLPETVVLDDVDDDSEDADEDEENINGVTPAEGDADAKAE